jgi:hypothetical protein
MAPDLLARIDAITAELAQVNAELAHVDAAGRGQRRRVANAFTASTGGRDSEHFKSIPRTVDVPCATVPVSRGDLPPRQGQTERDHDAPPFARSPASGSAGHRIPPKYLYCSGRARSGGLRRLVGQAPWCLNATDRPHLLAPIATAMVCASIVRCCPLAADSERFRSCPTD